MRNRSNPRRIIRMTTSTDLPPKIPDMVNTMRTRSILAGLTLVLLTGSRPAQGQTPDSIRATLSAKTYTLCAELAEPLIRSAILYRSHLGMWPIEGADVSEFLRANTKKLAPDSWEPCSLNGEMDGCMISVKIRPGTRSSFYLDDSIRVRHADARLYLTAPMGPQPQLRTKVTAELLFGELLTLEGKLIELLPHVPKPREFVTTTTMADSVMYVR